MAKLRGGTTIGGYLANHWGNFKEALSNLTTVTLEGDATGTGTFDANGDLVITTVVGNDSHTHGDSTINGLDASATTTGTFNIARIPTGTTGTTVALGNHTHSTYLPLATGGTVGGNITLSGANRMQMGSGGEFRFYYSGSTCQTELYGGNWIVKDATTTRFTFGRTTGDFTATGNVTAYSDERVKENIKVIPNALAKVSSLNGYTFDRTDIECDRQTGVIAQEVIKVLPEAVQEGDDGKLSVAYGNMVGLLIEAIKEQQVQIDGLKGDIDELRLQSR